MLRQELIEQRLRQKFHPLYLEVQNESHKHSVPKNSETHFRVVIVSESFTGLDRLTRSRMVNNLFKDEFSQGLHAFSQRNLTPAEWDQVKNQFKMESPACHSTVAAHFIAKGDPEEL